MAEISTRTVSAAGGNWNATTTWDEGAVPTAADDVVARGDGTSGNLAVNVAGMVCRSLDFTNYQGNWSFAAVTLAVGTSSLGPGGIALRLVTGMSVTPGSGVISFASTVTGNIVTALPGGYTLPAVTFNGTGSTYTLDGWKSATNAAFQVLRGSVDCTNATLTVGTISSTGAFTRSLNLTNATVNAGTTGTVLSLVATGLTFTATGSTYNVTNSGGTTKTVATGGVSCAGMTVNYTAAGGDPLTVTGASTFAAVNVTGGNHKLTLPAAATTTLTGSLKLRNGSLVSSTGGTAATLSAAGGVTIDVEAITIQDITAAGGATFAAVNSRDVSGNSGWSFRRLARGWGFAV